MDTTKENILRRTTCDRDLELNRENDTDIFPPIWTAFKRLYPARALSLSQKDGEEEDVNADNCAPPPPSSDSNQPRESSCDGKQEEERKKREEEEAARKEEERRAQLRRKGDEALEGCGIVTHAMTLKDFSRDVWSEKSNRADLILSALPSTRTIESLHDLPSFCTAVLKTGSYIF